MPSAVRILLVVGKSDGINTQSDLKVIEQLSVNDSEYDAAIICGKILKQVPVAIDELAIVVNSNLNIMGLTIKQLADIYREKITNWKEIGGQDLSIMSYARPL